MAPIDDLPIAISLETKKDCQATGPAILFLARTRDLRAVQSDQSKLDAAIRYPPSLREVMVTRKRVPQAVNSCRSGLPRGSVPRRPPIAARPPRFSRRLTVEAHHGPAMTSLRLLAGLNVGFKYASARPKGLPQTETRASRRRSTRQAGEPVLQTKQAARALYRRASHALRLVAWREKRAGEMGISSRNCVHCP